MDQSAHSLQQHLCSQYANVNRTELYQLGRKKGLTLNPAHSREQHLAVLAEALPDSPDNPVDNLRVLLIALIRSCWTSLQASLKCPAKNLEHHDPAKRDNKPCYKCLDMQVIACVADLHPTARMRFNALRERHKL